MSEQEVKVYLDSRLKSKEKGLYTHFLYDSPLIDNRFNL